MHEQKTEDFYGAANCGVHARIIVHVDEELSALQHLERLDMVGLTEDLERLVGEGLIFFAV